MFAMKLNVHIHSIKSIQDLSISLPVTKGLYAITGQNGAGKSTIVACAARVFFNIEMSNYFGKTSPDARIDFELDGATRSWYKNQNKWAQASNGNMNISGFYEGSLIFGNRFRDTTYEKLQRIDKFSTRNMIKADDFIRENLGHILQGETNFYEKLWMLPGNEDFDGFVFFYEKNGKRISQFHMSTGENLLVSILNSLNLRIKDRANKHKPCVIFLDEIELALHPSSLKRLVQFLSKLADEYNYAIYFSTHSIELISNIKPENIFYVERYTDNTMGILNPCYPAYATKILYDHSGYDSVILVEDDLAKDIVDRIIRKERLINNKMVHVMPCGGWSNVLMLAHDVVKNNLLSKKASICMVLDLDVKDHCEQFMLKNGIKNNIPIQYLPVESLEKYLRSNLFLNVNQDLFRLLDNYIFHQKSLREIIETYRVYPDYNATKDKDGKTLYALIENELTARNKSRKDLIEMVVDYLFEKNNENIKRITNFLKKQLQ